MTKLILFPLLFAAVAHSQSESFETNLELHLGQVGANTVLAELDRIHTAIIFQRLPGVSNCPGYHTGDFALKKVNPMRGKTAVVEHYPIFCSVIDTVRVDTTTIYEIPTSEGKTYYMRVLEPFGTKAKVRITSDLPAGIVPSTLAPSRELEDYTDNFDMTARGISFSEFVLLDGHYGNPVVLRGMPYPAVCPVTRYWDFELGKSDPKTGRLPIRQMITNICFRPDSLAVDVGQVYEVYTALGEKYFMQPLEWTGNRLKARFTLVMPPVALARNPRETHRSASMRRFRPDGRKTSLVNPSIPEFHARD
ncbi:MAG: hypothetical protein JWO30_3157 [Fibrobacteres bacterium]|nr:hypothetical protein [Fibrobacterota bacterium]